MYEIDRKKIREGLIELMKKGVNDVLENEWCPNTFAHKWALENYQSIKQLSLRFGIDIKEFDYKLKKSRDERIKYYEQRLCRSGECR